VTAAAQPAQPAAAPPEAAPTPPPADPAPAADHVAEAKAPAVPPDDRRVTAERRKAHRGAHERRAAHEHKEHASRASKGKHGREVALHAAAPSPQPGDDVAAREAYGKGNRLLLNGDTGGAIAAYEEATRLAPSSPVGYRGLGLAYEKQGKSSQAAKAFRTYLKLAPGAEDRALIAERLQRLASQHKSGKHSH
jgi:Flp pilus assembly protein TadD